MFVCVKVIWTSEHDLSMFFQFISLLISAATFNAIGLSIDLLAMTNLWLFKTDTPFRRDSMHYMIHFVV